MLFVCIDGSNIYSTVFNYTEKMISTDYSSDSEEIDAPDDIYSNYFPYFQNIYNSTSSNPTYSLNEYKIDNSIYRVSEIYSDDFEIDIDILISVEYFETDKSYLMTNFKSEKSFAEKYDSHENAIDTSIIKKVQHNGYTCFVTALDDEKRIKIAGDNYYFLLSIADENNYLEFDENQILDLATQQFELMQNDLPENE